MEGNGVTPIFSSLENCQFHITRLESLEHLFFVHFYIILVFWYVHFIIFARTLCMYAMCLTSLTDSIDDGTVSINLIE